MPQDVSEDNIAGNIQDNRFYKLKRTGASADGKMNTNLLNSNSVVFGLQLGTKASS